MGIGEFIKKHNLEHVIEKGIEIAKKHFPTAEIHLHLYQDPEIEKLRYIIIGLEMDNYGDDFLERVSKAYHELLGTVGWEYADFIDIDIKSWT